MCSSDDILDAFNLAWKVAYVHRGLAAPSLLSSYSIERQPVGASVIARANNGFREHSRIWEALGMLPAEVTTRKQALCELRAATPEGVQRRHAFQTAIKNTCHEFHGLGIEMNQRYEGLGIYDADESQPYQLTGRAAEDPVLFYEPSTYPGCRLPHVWLNRALPGAPVSTVDIAGHGAFTLFTGIGGEAWKVAAATVAATLRVPIATCSIGFRQDWEDVYFDWERLRGVEESGALLVRPDRFVAWRASAMLENAEACRKKLEAVLCAVLGWNSC